MTPDEKIIFDRLLDELLQLRRDVIQLTALHNFSEAGIAALLAIVETTNPTHDATNPKARPVHEAFVQARQVALHERLLELEKRDPAFAAQISAFLDGQKNDPNFGS